MKDPKQILESFRTDVHSQNIYSSLLRQFDLEYPNSKGNRRKPQKQLSKNMNQMAAALSVCLVTGLSAGVGSAFANSDIGPVQPPLDEAPSKANLNIEQPLQEGKELERKLPEHPTDLEKKEEARSRMDEQQQKNQKQTEAKDFPPIQNIPREIEKITIQERHENEAEKKQVDEKTPADNIPAEVESGHQKELKQSTPSAAQHQEGSVQGSKGSEVTNDKAPVEEKQFSSKTANQDVASNGMNKESALNDRQDDRQDNKSQQKNSANGTRRGFA